MRPMTMRLRSKETNTAMSFISRLIIRRLALEQTHGGPVPDVVSRRRHPCIANKREKRRADALQYAQRVRHGDGDHGSDHAADADADDPHARERRHLQRVCGAITHGRLVWVLVLAAVLASSLSAALDRKRKKSTAERSERHRPNPTELSNTPPPLPLLLLLPPIIARNERFPGSPLTIITIDDATAARSFFRRRPVGPADSAAHRHQPLITLGGTLPSPCFEEREGGKKKKCSNAIQSCTSSPPWQRRCPSFCCLKR